VALLKADAGMFSPPKKKKEKKTPVQPNTVSSMGLQ